MTAEFRFEGVLLRSAVTSDALTLVLESTEDFAFGELGISVNEIQLIGVDKSSIDAADLERGVGNLIWGTFSNKLATIQTDSGREQELHCARVASKIRDYDTRDLKAKVAHLGQMLQTGEDSNSKLSHRLSKVQSAITKFIESHRRTWSLKRNFFARISPVKAKEYEAKIGVLDEIEKYIRESA